MNRLDDLENKINYRFNDRNILIEALTHKSFTHGKDIIVNYERLEFLGDSVIQVLITEFLYTQFAGLDEGDLTRFRSNLVCEHFLSRLADKLDLYRYTRFGKCEILVAGNKKESILCDLLESLVGAIYIDGGLESSKKFFINLILEKDVLDIKNITSDSKSRLQQIAQKKFNLMPVYAVTKEIGRDHDRTFIVKATLNGSLVTQGEGKSKKKAEKNAATLMLKKLADEL